LDTWIETREVDPVTVPQFVDELPQFAFEGIQIVFESLEDRRASLEEVAGDQQLIRVKQTLDPFVLGIHRREQFTPLVRVPQELIDRLLQRVLDAGAFELGDSQRDTVDEQHGVGNHMPAPAGQFDLELIDD
jgi:hypothetical protein